MKQKQNFSQLFKPKSIAVIGASGTKGKVGNMIAKNIISHNYKGDVFFVNPKRDKILGRKCYKSLEEIGQKVDSTIVVVPGKFVEEVILQSVNVCKNFVVISAGFSETGLEGHNREMSLKNLAEKYNLNILGPNCLGFLIPSIGLNASFAEGLPKSGSIAVISQSGALAVAIMDKARLDNIGFSAVVSIGNKMQIDSAKLISYFARDKQTQTIALYLEGVTNGSEFLASIHKAVTAGKKVIILKAGKTKKAREAIALHTGSLAGSDEIFNAALEKVGALRAETMSEFFALVKLASCDNVAKNRKLPLKVGIVTNAGGPGVLATDAVSSTHNLIMSSLLESTKKILAKTLPRAASVHNPVDLLGDALLERYEIAVAKLLGDKEVNIVLVLLTPQDQTPVLDIAKMLVKKQKTTKKILIASFIGGGRVSTAISLLNKKGVLHFISVRIALDALDKFYNEPLSTSLVKKSSDKLRVEKVDKILTKAKNRKSLYFEECAKIAKVYDLPISKFWDITNGIGASDKIKYPCVVKADNPNLLHKTDEGGVLVSIKNLKELDEARKILLKRFSGETRIIVQPMLPIQTEIIVGMKRDPVFGVVIIAGLGGIYTEVFKKIDFFIAPLTLGEIKKKLHSGNIGFLFKKTRGLEKYDIDSLAKIIYNLSLLGMENPSVESIDINPLFIYNNDKKDVIVDFKIIL